jgi:hypothetical protein
VLRRAVHNHESGDWTGDLMKKRSKITKATRSSSSNDANRLSGLYCSCFRFLFGSIIGTHGKNDGGRYVITEVLLQEQKPSGVIDMAWLKNFVALDLRSLPQIPTILYAPLTKKRCEKAKACPNDPSACRSEEQEEEDDDDEDDEDEDEDDEPFLVSKS